MSYYPPNTEKELKKLEKVLDTELYTNVLTQMDNWSYHIRLSALKKSDYDQYMSLKTAAINENEPNIKKMQQIIENGITIAETGLINNIFIDSLTLQTLSSNGASLTTEGKLTLVDTQGTGFINKLNVLSLLTGNGANFSNQTYFITIWFVGYNGTSTIDTPNNIGMPNKEIEIFKSFKTYASQSVTDANEKNKTNTYSRTYIDRSTSKIYLEVVFTNVKCSASTNKATWAMNFCTQNSSLLTPQEVCVLSDLPDINLKSGDRYLEVVSKELCKNINEKIKNQMGKEAFSKAYYDETDPYSGKGDNVTCFDITINNELNQCLYTTIPTKKINKNQISKVNQSISKDLNLKFSSKQNLLNVFSTIIMEANHNNKNINYTPRISIVNKPMNIYNGKRYYHTFVTIWLNYTPGCDVCMNASLNPAELKNIPTAQVEIFKETEEHKNMFIRKYEWMTGNNKNGLLEYDSNKNNLWYLNSGLADKESAAHNTLNEQARTLKNEDPNIKKIVYNAQKPQLPTLPNDLKTMNDVWEYAKEINYVENLSLYPISIKDSNIGANDPITLSSGTIKDNVERAGARIGYQNLLDSANALSIKLNIIGDPIWLDLGSAILPEEVKTSLTMMILFKENTTFNLNNKDLYEPDPLLQSMIPYQITKITSDFCNGVFKQTLEGHAPAIFLFDKNSIDQLTNFTMIENLSNKKAEDNTTQTKTNNSVAGFTK